MKKIGSGRRAWLLRRDCRIRCSARPRLKIRNRTNLVRDMLVAPAYFTIAAALNERSSAAQQFLSFLSQVRAYRGQRLCIDMTKVSRLVVNAALLFKAELCYLKAKGVHLSGVAAIKARTRQVLTQTGIAELLGLPPAATVDREDIIHWRYASGLWTLAQPSRLAALLAPGLNPATSSLYTGMIESVSNAIEHAYLEHPARRRFFEEQEGWWGFQQVRDGYVSTCICDLGIGIPNALPIRLSTEPGLYRKLVALVNHVKGEDVRSILAAIEYGRSSTKQPQRGKGLRDAHRVIDDAGEGDFQLASNRGFYFYKREPGKAGSIKGTRRLQGTISGTIYYWRFPLKSDLDSEEPEIQGALP